MIVLHHTRHPLRDRRALFRRRGRDCNSGNEYVGLAVYIMRFRPIRYGWAGAPPVYCC